jgi:hypothetical protein
MDNFERTVNTVLGLVMMGMMSATVAGDMMGSEKPMTEETMMEHEGMGGMKEMQTMDGEGVHTEPMAEEGEGDAMMNEMQEEQGMIGEKKNTM